MVNSSSTLESPGASLLANRFPMPRSAHRFFPRLKRFEDHPKAWVFPEMLNPAVPWVATLRALYASPLSFPASIAPEAGLFLHSLVRNIRPRTVLEIGTFIGISTIWMASALADADRDPEHSPVAPGQRRGVIHCFDDFGPIVAGPWRDAELVDRPRIDFVRDQLTAAGLVDRVTLHQGNSSEQVRAAHATLRGSAGSGDRLFNADPAAYTGGIDLAYIDGDHTPAGVIEDLRAVEPVLNTGGYIVLHDVFPEQCSHEGPRHLLDHVMEVAAGLYELCEIYTAPLNYGMTVLRRLG